MDEVFGYSKNYFNKRIIKETRDETHRKKNYSLGNWYEIETDGSGSLPKSYGWLSLAGGCGQIGHWDPNWTDGEDEDEYFARSAREDFEKLDSLYAIRIKQSNELNKMYSAIVEGSYFKQEEPILQESLVEETSINSCKRPKLSP